MNCEGETIQDNEIPSKEIPAGKFKEKRSEIKRFHKKRLNHKNIYFGITIGLKIEHEPVGNEDMR